jgi:hypothetical protein
MQHEPFSLCPECDACPEVVFGEDNVVIGEEGNQVTLAAAEWNVLVAAVRSGELGPAAGYAGPEPSASAACCGCGCCGS